MRRLQPLPVEAVVRGYLIGSGWKDYQANGQVCGIALPPGLQQASKLPAPIFTPATKAAAGQHDENISFAEIEKPIGADDRRAGAGARTRTLRFRGRVRARRAASSSPTPSSSSAWMRAASSC